MSDSDGPIVCLPPEKETSSVDFWTLSLCDFLLNLGFRWGVQQLRLVKVVELVSKKQVQKTTVPRSLPAFMCEFDVPNICQQKENVQGWQWKNIWYFAKFMLLPCLCTYLAHLYLVVANFQLFLIEPGHLRTIGLPLLHLIPVLWDVLLETWLPLNVSP